MEEGLTDPFALIRLPIMVLQFWVKHAGKKTVVGLLAGGTVLAVILNYTT